MVLKIWKDCLNVTEILPKNYLNIALSGGDLAGCWRNSEGHARLNIARTSKIHPPLDPYHDMMILWYYYDMMLALARTSKIHPPLLDPYFHIFISWYHDTIHISRTKWSLHFRFIDMMYWLGGEKISVFCWGCLRILKGLNYEEVMLLQNSQITQSWWGVSHIYLTQS